MVPVVPTAFQNSGSSLFLPLFLHLSSLTTRTWLGDGSAVQPLKSFGKEDFCRLIGADHCLAKGSISLSGNANIVIGAKSLGKLGVPLGEALPPSWRLLCTSNWRVTWVARTRQSRKVVEGHR